MTHGALVRAVALMGGTGARPGCGTRGTFWGPLLGPPHGMGGVNGGCRCWVREPRGLQRSLGAGIWLMRHLALEVFRFDISQRKISDFFFFVTRWHFSFRANVSEPRQNPSNWKSKHLLCAGRRALGSFQEAPPSCPSLLLLLRPDFPLCALLVLVAPGPCGSWPSGFAGHGSVPFGWGCASRRVRSLPLCPGVGKRARAAQILGLRWGQEGVWHGDGVGDEHQPVTQ